MPARRRKTEEGGDTDIATAAWEANYEAEYETIEEALRPGVRGYSLRELSGGKTKVQVLGQGFKAKTKLFLGRKRLKTKFINSSTLEAEVSTYMKKTVGPYAPLSVTGGQLAEIIPLTAERVSQPAVLSVKLNPKLPREGKPFDLTVSFKSTSREKIVAIRLWVQFPNGEQKTDLFSVTPQEQRVGRKTLSYLQAGIWGPLRMRVTVYATRGGASTRYFKAEVVPNNPFQVTVYPQYNALSWKGAVKYDSASKRYYCYARAVFSNGNSYPVTINRNVRVRVTDGGSHVTSFSFNLNSSYTVQAGSSLTLYVYTYYKNSATADIFKSFGDVRIELKFSTSVGDVADSAVWVMMGQVKVACNFVGSFTGSEHTTVRNIVLGAASAIYEQVDLSITSAPTLEIPSSNSDWNRFRVIRIDDCKNGVSSDEADDMRDDWSSPSTYPKHVDMWFVEAFSGESCAVSTGGFSPTPGPASKSGDKSGVVIDVDDLDPVNSNWGRNVLSVVVAHELAHYLGLSHHSSSSNFMASSTGGTNTNITWSQHNTMEDHGWVQRRNP